MSRSVTRMTIHDALHYSKDEIDAIVAAYPAHERDARAKGVPQLGSGRIFPVADEQILVEPFEIPSSWVVIGGIDFGWDHPTAAAKLAWDRDSDTVYVTAAYKCREKTPIMHAAALRPWGEHMPWAWPHDGLQHDKGSGVQLKEAYAKQGLNMLEDRAMFEDGSNGVEAGIIMMLERFQTGRLKIFDHLHDVMDEIRLYHRKDGKVVKEFDDVLCAIRYALMCLRFARTEGPIGYIPQPKYASVC